MTEPERKKTLLIVEDNASLRLALATLLQREGYSVKLAVNGAQALSYLNADSLPDLILLDMLMPILDGWHFLPMVQQSASSSPIPIVVTTSSTVIGQEWTQAHGCAGVLRKPIEPDELLQEVRRLLSQGTSGEEHPG